MAARPSRMVDRPSGAATGEGSVVFFGSHAVDYYFKCASWPREGQKINATPAGRTYGGMIPNAVSIFAGYGTAPLLLGPLEDNDDAARIIDELTAAGVDTRFVRRSPAFRNSYAYNFLTEDNPGEKTLIIVDPGYAFEMTERERHIFVTARSIYSTIAHLGRIGDAPRLMAAARRQGAKLFIDVEAESFRSADEEWWAFSAADFVSFNEESLEKFCRGRGTDAAIAALLSATGGEVIVTLGSEGCEVITDRERVRVPGIRVAAVDPLGAGDTFNATYLFGRMSGWPIDRAARFANAAAARSTTLFGPRSGRANVQQVEDFLRNLETQAAAAASPASAGSG